jgi:hypothetical protein
MLGLLVSLLILVLVCGLIWWILGMIPIPPQFRWVVNVIIAVIFLIAIIELLAGGLVIPIGRLR